MTETPQTGGGDAPDTAPERAPTTASPPGGGKSGRKIGDGWLIGGMVVASLLSIGAIMGWAFSDSGGKSSVSSDAPPQTKTVEVTMGEFWVKPAKLEVDPNTTLILKVTNEGEVPHDLKVGNVATPMLDPGESAEITTGAIMETTKGYCTVAGHEAAGMKMDIVVKASSGGGGGDVNTAAEPDNSATVDPTADPSDDVVWYDPVLAPAPEGTVHDITFDMVDVEVEVAPGVTQMLWLFNGTMPGPTLRGKVGDTFNITLKNSGTMGHSIDFHASQTAMDIDMRTIQPGESLVYTFEAKHAGVWMYHCGTEPVLHHIANGMFGAVVIDPPDLEPVDHEYIFVQNDIYFGENGKETSLDKAMVGQPDAVMFNGYYNQYVYNPIDVKVGDRIRMFVLDVGPNEISAFHVVGLQFDVVYNEGGYRLRKDDPLKGGAQMIDLLPAQGGFVEAVIPAEGKYAFVSHKFNDASRGAAGHFIASP